MRAVNRVSNAHAGPESANGTPKPSDEVDTVGGFNVT